MRNKELNIRQEDFLNYLDTEVNISLTELENLFLNALHLFLIDNLTIEEIIKNKHKGVDLKEV